jgi:hypothetical protein
VILRKFTDVSGEIIASTFKVEEKSGKASGKQQVE